jgi:hypothetical protein
MVIDLIESAAGLARLNRALNIIEGVTLIRAQSANGGPGGRRYSDTALRQIAAMAEGLPAYLNHVAKDQAFKPRDVKDLAGVHRNARYFPTEGKIITDLHVAAHQAPLVFGLAETLDGVIGNSLVSRGAVRMEGDVEVVEDIVVVRSADLVSDPATTKGLFESRERFTHRTGETPMNKTLQEVIAANDLHEWTSAALEHRAYVPPDERARRAGLVEAILNGKDVKDAVVLFTEGRPAASTVPAPAPAKVRATPRPEGPMPQDLYERLAAAAI